METLSLPLIPIDQKSGKYLVFLPNVDTERLERIGTEMREEERIFAIYCVYGKNKDGSFIGNIYPIEINEQNRAKIQNLEQIIVLHPDDKPIDEITQDPDFQDQLRRICDHVRRLEQKYQHSI